MGQDTRIRFIVILILTAIAAMVVAPIDNKPFFKDFKVRPGIDLSGGAELRYRFEYSDDQKGRQAELTQEAVEIIRLRVEAKQLKEPRINAIGDNGVVIQLAGVDRQELDAYKRLIGQGGKLELFETAPRELQEQFNATKVVPEGWKKIANPKPRQTPEYAAWGDPILIRSAPIITGRHIIKSEPQSQLMPGTVREWYVTFDLNADGSKLFDEAAARLYVQRPPGMIAIVLDDKLNSSPAVQTDRFGGSGRITGIGGEQEAKDLSIILRSGKLPGRIVLEQETFVGPTLGQDAIRRGKLASYLTLGLVALFMFVYYRAAGGIAVLSLFLNLLFLMAIMSFANATMTLPGIAGIVLTVGMAVDANILILERIREEQARGKSALQAYEAGHERAFSAILDGNVTTLVAAAVLYYFGTGPVQGFAVTLSIGILTTLFSVLFCSRTFLKMLISGGLSEFRMLRLMSDPKIDYLRIAGKLTLMSAVMVSAGLLFVVVRGKASFGIDFNGGSTLTFRAAQDVPIQDVRSRLQGIKGDDGLPRYKDVEVQTIASPGGEKAQTGSASSNFQLRTGATVNEDPQKQAEAMARLKADVQEALKDVLSHEPFEAISAEQAKAFKSNPREFDGDGPQAAGALALNIYVKDGKGDAQAVEKRLAPSEFLRDVLLKDAKGDAKVRVLEVPGAPKGLKKLALVVPAADADKKEGLQARLQEAIRKTLKDDLADDPFIAEGQLGSAVAKELQNSTIIAMIVSWVLMIIYIAFRFDSWKYGVAAVAALVHDALIALAFTALAGAVVPASWGLSFEMNLTTMAAILTIIGYSINDTIVIFDRIRENLTLMKKGTFAEVINGSVNQTMSRTILTSFTVWISCAVLYAFTARTGGGIAEFAFPLLIGVLAGTYSTIYIASPILIWLYKSRRPDAA
jgi:SecD/SecF fusion protein